jgi:plasmid stabilization system protein ParE
VSMTDATHILSDIEQDDARAAERLLPLVYDELSRPAGGAGPDRGRARVHDTSRLRPRLLIYNYYYSAEHEDGRPTPFSCHPPR